MHIERNSYGIPKIRGWLLLLQIHLALAPLFTLATMLQLLQKQIDIIESIYIGSLLLLLIMQVRANTLMASRKFTFIKSMKIVIAFTIFLNSLDLIVYANTSEYVVSDIIKITTYLAWFEYLKRSQRVKMTFIYVQ